MKKGLLTFLIIALVSAVHFADTPITKHALIIAIGDYPVESNWKKISSLNDIDLIRSALERQGDRSSGERGEYEPEYLARCVR